MDGKTTFQTNPGPGKYSHKDMITKMGIQTVSNFKSSGATTFNPPSSKRFEKISKIPFNGKYFLINNIYFKKGNAAPGPGTYVLKNDLDNSGHYVLS